MSTATTQVLISFHAKFIFTHLIQLYYRHPVTVFKYGVEINGTAADGIKAPTAVEISEALTSHNLKVTWGARKLRKVYLVGARSNLNYTAIAISLSAAWSETNAGTCDRTLVC